MYLEAQLSQQGKTFWKSRWLPIRAIILVFKIPCLDFLHLLMIPSKIPIKYCETKKETMCTHYYAGKSLEGGHYQNQASPYSSSFLKWVLPFHGRIFPYSKQFLPFLEQFFPFFFCRSWLQKEKGNFCNSFTCWGNALRWWAHYGTWAQGLAIILCKRYYR